MKTWILPTEGSGLVLTDRPSRAPGDTEIKIRMRGWSLNYRDGGVAKGPVQRDTIPLSDGAGDVVAVGSRVTRFKVGDRVAGTFFQNWIGGPMRADVPGSDLGGPVDGVLAEEVILCEQGVVRIPDHLSYAEVSGISPCGTESVDCVREDFWLIVVTEGNGDEAEIHGAEIGCRAGRPGYPSADAQTLFGGGEDPHCVVRPSWRGQHRGAVPARRHR